MPADGKRSNGEIASNVRTTVFFETILPFSHTGLRSMRMTGDRKAAVP